MAVSYEHCNEPSGSMEGGEFKIYRLFQKSSAPRTEGVTYSDKDVDLVLREDPIQRS